MVKKTNHYMENEFMISRHETEGTNMQENSRIHFIPPVSKREEEVGIYCCVSTYILTPLGILHKGFRIKEYFRCKQI